MKRSPSTLCAATIVCLGAVVTCVAAAAAEPEARKAHFYKPKTVETRTASGSASGAASGARSGAEANAGRAPVGRPLRIVSLAPVVTETLFALGAGDRVVGVTRFCDRPAAAQALPKIGGFIDPQLEAILALKPDLVIAQPSRGVRTTLDRLRDRGVPVLVGFGDTLAEVRDLVLKVGDAVDAAAAARRKVAALDAALDKLRRPQTHRSPRVLVLVGARPLVAAGRGTFVDEALELVGARQALTASTPQWPTLSVETVGVLQPDVIVAAGGPADAAALQRTLAGLGARRPPIVSGKGAFLMRPGPSLDDDVALLQQLLDEAAAQ